MLSRDARALARSARVTQWGHASGEGEDSHISNVSQPQCGRIRVGSRIYCETCDMVRVDTGKTPMKPVRAVRGPPTPILLAPSFVDAGEQVSPLTEARGSGGGSGMLRQAAGMIGAALSAAQGTGVVPPAGKSPSVVHDAATWPSVPFWLRVRHKNIIIFINYIDWSTRSDRRR